MWVLKACVVTLAHKVFRGFRGFRDRRATKVTQVGNGVHGPVATHGTCGDQAKHPKKPPTGAA